MRLSLRKPGKKNARPSPFRRGTTRTLDPHTRRWGPLVLATACVVLVAALTYRIKPDDAVIAYDIDSEIVASETFIAEFQFESRDLSATRELMNEAEQAVPDTYRVEPLVVEDRLSAFEAQIAHLRELAPALSTALENALLASTSQQDEQTVVNDAVAAYVLSLVETDEAFADTDDPGALQVWLTPRLESLPERVYEEAPEGTDPGTVIRRVAALKQPETGAIEFAHLDQLAEVTHAVLDYILSYGLLQPAARSETFADSQVVGIHRDRTSEDYPPVAEIPVAKMPLLVSAQQRFLDRVAALIEARSGDDAAQIPLELATVQHVAHVLARPFITGTLVFDREYTLAAKNQARARVEETPVMKRIDPNLTIQAANQRWTEQSREDVRTYLAEQRRGAGTRTSLLASLFANMLFVALALGCQAWATPLLARKEPFLSLCLALATMCCTLVVGRVVSHFEPTGYEVPVAAGPLLLAILLNGRVAALTGFLTAVLLSIQFGYSWPLLMVGVAMSLTGVFSIFVVRRRSDIGRAVFRATFVGLLMMTAVSLSTDSLFTETAFQHLLLIGLNGLACLFLVPGLLPPLERLSGITTDIQMLEYSDLNNEVLGRLAIEIPATYAHSLMLGQLAEAAADAIGANGLQARVCAYYHDIGKLHRPDYFSENQTGQNIHEGLTPRLSARAIAGHVTRGADMAREFHLPKPIVDGILEHHGTCLISFFYDEAMKQQKHGDVVETDFRYPGPKPQSPETAILMICDGVESGVRSIKSPNEERVREFIDRIIMNRAEDRQFEECDLTLKDLNTIREVVTHRMLSSLHRRIAYPDPDKERQTGNVIPLSGGRES